MTRPVVFPDRNGDILVDIEGYDESLCENIHNVIVTVGAVVEVNTKGVLPLLGLQNMAAAAMP